MKRFIIYVLMLCGGTAGYLYHRKYGGPEITPWPMITLAVAWTGGGLLWQEFIWPRLRGKGSNAQGS